MKKLSEMKTSQERRVYLKDALGVNLESISQAQINDIENIHCENLIGATSVPLGVGGPLKMKNEKGEMKDYYVPLATTEGALVASVNRGCKAITEAGGAHTNSHRAGTTRGPVFYTGSVENGQKLHEWIRNNTELCSNVAEKTSSHLKFKSAHVRKVADYAFIRFSFITDEAMGMNMVTIATQAICEYVERETGFKCVAVAGNFDIDKKPAWLNFIEGRGLKVWAEVLLPSEILQEVLKTTAQKMFDVWYAKCFLGSAMAGSLGFNSQFANVIAAIFIATGQDTAHVVEGSMGITTTKIMTDGALYVSVYLPSIMIGTIGGGTKLKTQQESLQIVGAKNVLELGEVIGGAVLAGEVSLLASLAEGSLAITHKKLGR